MARTETYDLRLAHVGVDKAIAIYQDRPNNYWKQMAPTIPWDQAYYRVLQEADFSIAPAIGQSQALPIEDFETPYTKDFTPLKFALSAGNSWESLQSDVLGIIKKTGDKLIKAVNKRYEVAGASFINLATDTATTSLGPDGVALASASHPYQNGTTTNILTSNPVLSQAALETARYSLITQYSHKGDPMAFGGPFVLYVPPALISVAERAVGARNYGVAGVNTGTALGNDPNVMDASKIKIVMNPWFTNAAAWGLRCANEEDHGLRFIQRKAPTSHVWNDDATESTRTGVSGLICPAIFDWRGFVYSSGAGS